MHLPTHKYSKVKTDIFVGGRFKRERYAIAVVHSKQLSKEIIVLFGSIFVFTGWGGGWWDGAKPWKQKGEVSFASIVNS